jgi:hypothetical protein
MNSTELNVSSDKFVATFTALYIHTLLCHPIQPPPLYICGTICDTKVQCHVICYYCADRLQDVTDIYRATPLICHDMKRYNRDSDARRHGHSVRYLLVNTTNTLSYTKIRIQYPYLITYSISEFII